MKKILFSALAGGVLAASAAFATPASALVTYSFAGFSGDNFIIVGPQTFSFTQPTYFSQTATVMQFTGGNATSATFCFPGSPCGFFGLPASGHELRINSLGGSAIYTFSGFPFTMNGVNVATSGTNAGTLTVTGSPTTTEPPTSAVPEPTTWAMMLAGFGTVGFAMRRRRKGAPRAPYAV